MHRVNMSSDALIEKPNSGRYRCRRQAWYIILLSFLLWFGLFYLYSSIMVRDHEESSLDSESRFVHDVVENEDSSEIRDSESDSVGESDSGNEAEIVLKNNSDSESDRSLLSREIDDVEQVMDLVRELEAENITVITRENENESTDPPPIVDKEKEKEKIARKPPVRTRKEAPKPKRRPQKVDPAPVVQKRRENVQLRASSCSGRYIYIHNIPKKFNQDLLDNCRSLSEWTDYCELASNNGLGPYLPDYDKVYSRSGWFGTSQFFLEVIFHNRMKQYKCLTEDPSTASAIFVPYYAGLDVQRYLWDSDGFMRGYDALNLVKWLASRPEWKRMWGGDHFLVAGRINWDFRRDPKNVSDWGNELLNLPETRNMTNLVIESSPWNYNDFAIPYPTYFHPSSDNEVFQWQNKVRRMRRKFLFSFAGGPRPNLRESIRNDVIDQCKASRRKCKYFECETKNNKCDKPVYVMKLMQNSIFCLQPPGDSYTRKSVFDSILAGCIPVFFHPGTAYVQYIWHLPKDYTKYSVFIPGNDIKTGKASIERTLQRIPREKRAAMREEVIKLIPNVIYANPTSRLETLEDAFDLTVKGVLERVETVKKQIDEGKYLNSDFLEDDSWKYFTYGTTEPHEWDQIFANREM